MAKEISLDLRKDIKDVFNKLQNKISVLNAMMVDSGGSHVVFSIPTRLEEDEPATSIRFATLSGEDAWDAAKESYSQLYRIEDQHHRATVRAPGIIFVKNFDEVRGIVAEVNLLKDKLKALFLSIPASQRNRIAAQTLPGVVLLQAYRHIDVNTEDARRLVFSWVRTNSIKKVTKEQVVKTIEQEYQSSQVSSFAPDDMSVTEWLETLKSLKSDVERLSDNQVIRSIKPISPHPRLIVFGESSRNPLKTFHANMPLIMPAVDDMPQIRMLKPLNGGKKGKERKDKVPRERLSPYFHFYL